MPRPHTALIAVLALIGPSLQAATVYKYMDEDGNLVFTDEPVEGAEKLNVQPVPTVPAVPVPASSGEPQQQEKPFSYNQITIVTPSAGENFVNNGGKVTIQVAMSPELRPSDKLQLYFNGEPKGKPQSSTVFDFNNLYRGEYVTRVVAVNEAGEQLGQSDTITFYVRRSAIGGTN